MNALQRYTDQTESVGQGGAAEERICLTASKHKTGRAGCALVGRSGADPAIISPNPVLVQSAPSRQKKLKKPFPSRHACNRAWQGRGHSGWLPLRTSFYFVPGILASASVSDRCAFCSHMSIPRVLGQLGPLWLPSQPGQRGPPRPSASYRGGTGAAPAGVNTLRRSVRRLVHRRRRQPITCRMHKTHRRTRGLCFRADEK